jgi:hypothetical protein
MLSLPILRQKMAQSCGMMFIDLLDGCCYGDRMKQNEQNRNRSEFKMIKQNKWMQIWTTGKITNNNRQIMNSKLAANNDADAINHEQKPRGKCWLTYFLEGSISCDYGTDICNPVCPGVCQEAPDVMLLVSLPFQLAHLWPLGNP